LIAAIFPDMLAGRLEYSLCKYAKAV